MVVNQIPKKYRVDIIESECGWGRKIVGTKYFDSEEKALQFCNDYNTNNKDNQVPGWYMMAEYIGKMN